MVLTLASGVSVHTGDLRFDGEIFIDGDIASGFSVEATDAVVVTGTVAPGAVVKSGGNITVGAGIVGRRTRISSGGDVQAGFVREARVVAEGDIRLERFAERARLQAGRRITVSGTSGRGGGRIAGGEAWAGRGIDVRAAGAGALLAAALTPDQAQRLDRIVRGMETSYEHILRILRQFGLTRMDVAQIQNLIRASSGPRRKLLANRARRLGELAQAYQDLLAEKQALQQTMREAAATARIRISGSVEEGTQIRLGRHHLVVKTGISSPCFHVRDDRLVERGP